MRLAWRTHAMTGWGGREGGKEGEYESMLSFIASFIHLDTFLHVGCGGGMGH